MRKVANILLVLFAIIISGTTSADPISNSTTLKLQVVVSESLFSQNCTIDFDNFNVRNNKLLRTYNNNCQFNSAKLFKKAAHIASTKLSHQDTAQFVTITVTTP